MHLRYAALLALAGVLSACGGTSPSAQPAGGSRALSAFTAGAGGSTPATDVRHRYALPTSTVGVPLTGISWMQGTTLHLGGRSVDTGVRAQSYTLLPGGVLLYRGGSLWFSDTESRAREVADGVVGPDGVHLSPDGRHVAFLDRRYGPVDDSGRHLYRLDVLDTRTGAQVLTKVLGDPDQPVARQYDEAAPALIGLGDRAAYVRGIGGPFRYPFDGSARTRPRTSAIPFTTHGGPWVRTQQLDARYRIGPGPGPRNGALSPSGRVALFDTRHYTFAPFDTETGAPLELSPLEGTNNFALGGWLRGGSFWGFGFQGLHKAIRGSGQITLCSVDAGECTAASGRLTSTSRDPLLVGGSAR